MYEFYPADDPQGYETSGLAGRTLAICLTGLPWGR